MSETPRRIDTRDTADCLALEVERLQQELIRAEESLKSNVIGGGYALENRGMKKILRELMEEFPNSHVRLEKPDLWQRWKAAIND